MIASDTTFTKASDIDAIIKQTATVNGSSMSATNIDINAEN